MWIFPPGAPMATCDASGDTAAVVASKPSASLPSVERSLAPAYTHTPDVVTTTAVPLALSCARLCDFGCPSVGVLSPPARTVSSIAAL